jgi:hypothetical protein
MQGIDREARRDHGGVFDAQGILIRGPVEWSTDDARQVLRRYWGTRAIRT